MKHPGGYRAAALQRSRAHVRALNRRAAESLAGAITVIPQGKCPCGLPLSPNRIICTCCWQTAPQEWRAGLKSWNREDRMRACDLLQFHARCRKPIPATPTHA